MKIKLSDYIADFFAENGITTVFTVVGGGSMHMNDSFGHYEKIKCIYNHHEQASAMAAEAYFRVNNEIAGLCITSGPGAINALNGVVGAYQDSVPVMVLSGQCKSSLTTRKRDLNLRTLGNQEFDIISALANVCKYSEMITDANNIRYCLEKALYICRNGRPGPCWLDIPVDIQGAYIETDELKGYDIPVFENADISGYTEKILEILKKSRRPILYAGNGIRISGSVELFRELTETLQIPVVTCWDSIDLIETDNELYCGRAGIMGDRAGNFAVQNSDMLIVIGSRLNIYQVGYQIDSWARESFVVYVDIDPEELKKPTIRTDMTICCDAGFFMRDLQDKLKESQYTPCDKEWLNQCISWKKKYPVVSRKQFEQNDLINIYAFMDALSRRLEENTVTVVANGSASVVGSASYYVKKNSRFIMNCGLSSMGYDLPASVGVAQALRAAKQKRQLVCIAGDGSIMMNIQELQTIVTNKFPIKIIIINNNGYQQIRITQTNLFNGNFVGLGPDSNDLGFPDFKKVAYAFGIPYFNCNNMNVLSRNIDEFLNVNGYAILEVFCDTKQIFEPKSATKKLKDGRLYSPPLEDLYPFLPREELKKNMFISLINEEE